MIHHEMKLINNGKVGYMSKLQHKDIYKAGTLAPLSYPLASAVKICTTKSINARTLAGGKWREGYSA